MQGWNPGGTATKPPVIELPLCFLPLLAGMPSNTPANLEQGAICSHSIQSPRKVTTGRKPLGPLLLMGSILRNAAFVYFMSFQHPWDIKVNIRYVGSRGTLPWVLLCHTLSMVRTHGSGEAKSFSDHPVLSRCPLSWTFNYG